MALAEPLAVRHWTVHLNVRTDDGDGEAIGTADDTAMVVVNVGEKPWENVSLRSKPPSIAVPEVPRFCASRPPPVLWLGLRLAKQWIVDR